MGNVYAVWGFMMMANKLNVNNATQAVKVVSNMGIICAKAAKTIFKTDNLEYNKFRARVFAMIIFMIFLMKRITRFAKFVIKFAFNVKGVENKIVLNVIN